MIAVLVIWMACLLVYPCTLIAVLGMVAATLAFGSEELERHRRRG